MNLDQTINDEIKKAMLAKEEGKLRTLRAIKSAFLLAKTEKGASGELNDEQIIKILQKMKKQREDSLDIYVKQNREDLASKEREEISVIDSFLPAQLSDDELINILKNLAQQLGVTDIKGMGKLMGAASRELSGKADGKRIAEVVKEILG